MRHSRLINLAMPYRVPAGGVVMIRVSQGDQAFIETDLPFSATPYSLIGMRFEPLLTASPDATPAQLDALAASFRNEADRQRGGKDLVLSEDELNALGALLGNRTAIQAVEQVGHAFDTILKLQNKVARAQGFGDTPHIYWG